MTLILAGVTRRMELPSVKMRKSIRRVVWDDLVRLVGESSEV